MSPTHEEQAGLVVNQLLATHNKAVTLVLSLRLRGEEQLRLRAEAKARELFDAIEALLQEQINAWLDQSEQLVTDGRALNTKLQGHIRDVRNNVEVANRAVKALGLIDDAIATATGLLA